MKKFCTKTLLVLLVSVLICNMSLASTSGQTKAKKYKVSGGERTYAQVYEDDDFNEESEVKSFMKGYSTAKQYNTVNRIGNKLLAVTDIPVSREVTFTVARKYDANAYADWKNQVVIYRGILDYLEYEDELAFIIGHEIAHIDCKHVKHGMMRQAGIVFASAVLSGIAGETAGSATEVSANLANKKFSRVDETKADEKGVDYMVLAGYNPLAAISILNKIGSKYVDFWADHPSTQKRVYHDYEYIKSKYPQYLEKGFNTESYEIALKQIKLREEKEQNIKIAPQKKTSEKPANKTSK